MASHSLELCTKLYETNLLIFNHMMTDQLQHRNDNCLSYHCYGKRPCQSCVGSTRDFACSQTNDHGIWPGNETTCAHAYKIRKWRPSQRTATTECCEWLLLTRVNMTVSTQTVCYIIVEQQDEYEKWHFHDHTVSRLAVFCVAVGHLYESC